MMSTKWMDCVTSRDGACCRVTSRDGVSREKALVSSKFNDFKFYQLICMYMALFSV